MIPPATAPPVAPPSRRPPLTTNPYVGILGVFLGAGIATLNTRLLSVGLPDLRGARGFGYDQGSWIPTALSMATMFSGVFVVFVNALSGPRRILLPAAATFAMVSLLLPLAPSYWVMLGLVTIAGVSSGTFYTLTMTFVLTALPKRLIILGIAAYAADIIFVSYSATALEGWYIEHLSWRWIFWTGASLTPLMIICVYYGIPQRPRPDHRPNWRGFVYFSAGFGLLCGALDQGERLDWLNSGVFVAMLAAGLLLVGAAVRRASQPNPTLNLSFLNQRNVIILGSSIFVFKFAQLADLMLVPGFLGNIQGYRPLQTGQALMWVALPAFAVAGLVAALMIHTSSRLILTVGLTVAAVACWFCAQLDTSWAANNFVTMELFMAVGFAGTFTGLVGSIVLEGLESGALRSPANAATFAGFMHFIRIFGGAVGSALMTRFISVREQFHSNLLGLDVQTGSWLTDRRLRMLGGALLPDSTGPQQAQHRAITILGDQVRAQAYTMAIADGFILVGWMVAAYLLMTLLLKPGKITFKDLRKMQ